ncbi:MAG: hypothetical protein JNL58_13820 [Planctomyces sp.]|nr:hypothetical protein [Planctomyces sp.]
MSTFLSGIRRTLKQHQQRRTHLPKNRRTRFETENLESRIVLSAVVGTIYDDTDGNGVRNNGENGLQDWTVYLDLDNSGTLNNKSDGNPEPSAVTNKDGDYVINSILPGTYRVTEIVKPGWTPTQPLSQDVTVIAGKDSKANFFNFAGGTIVGTVWNDLNADGLRDSDPETGEVTDPGLEGWTVFLDLDTNEQLDPGEPQTLTDANGNYTFFDVPAGDYEVTEILPIDWEVSPTYDTKQTATIEPLTEFRVDFANYSLTNGSIQGVIWNDTNMDGIRQTDSLTGDFIEPGLADWVVFVDENNDRLLDAGELWTLTDANGHYGFISLPAGDYEITEVLPSGWEPSPTFDIRQTVSVFGGENTTADDFANFTVLNGSVRGTIWNDLNRDGLRNRDLGGAFTEPGLSDWTVYLDMNSNGIPDETEPTATTDAGGQYSFLDLQVGDYDIRELLPSGWETAPGYGDNQTVTIFSGSETVAGDFANFNVAEAVPGTISGRIWNDLNGNGLLDLAPVAEPGIEGRIVYVDTNLNGLLDGTEASATTDADGNYSIGGILPGTISLVQAPSSGWLPTAPVSGKQSILLKNNGNVSNINFGNRQLSDSAIRGAVFADTNKDGLRGSGEHGIAGITVFLDLNQNALLDSGEPSTVTSEDLFFTPDIDEKGTYSFTHLSAGTFTVRQIVPAVLSATPVTEIEHQVTINAAEERSGVNFADVYRANEIHGVRFEDKNKNLLKDDDEPGIPNTTIFIDLDRDDLLDDDEPRTTTLTDGSYSFTGLTPGAYVVREVIGSGYSHGYPGTRSGDLWPEGTSNAAQGNVSPAMITTSLAVGQSYHQTVSLTLPGSGALTNAVDVFLLFDDTGSFVNNSPIVRAAFPNIITQLQTSLTGIDLAFGVGRFEEYGNFASEYATGRPFILNQPIVAASTGGYMAAIQAALNRTTPGYGGDGPETDIEALYQLVTGLGFDGNNNGSVLDSGAAGLGSTQLTPGNSGDVPSFASFTADASSSVLPAAGTIGGAGFRAGALPVILLATDIGFAYQPQGETSISGINGLTLPVSSLTGTSRSTTPFGSGAGLQETITGLNALGALVIGLGTNPQANVDPRQGLEALSKLTGATNQSSSTIPNGTADPIAPGDPFYFQIATGFAGSVADGVRNAIQNAVTNVAVNITVQASDPRVRIINHSGVQTGVTAGQTATFDIEFIGDGIPHRFDLQFVREGTNVVLGSIPVVLGTPISGDGYHFDDLEDGEYELEDHFGDYSDEGGSAPSDIILSASGIAENSAAGTSVGFLSTTDSDSTNPFTYSLVSGSGSTDNASFTLDGNVLRTATGFDYEARNSYSIRVRTTDSSGLTFEKSFAISIADQPEGTTADDAFVLTYSGTTPDGTVTVTVSTNRGAARNLGTFSLGTPLSLFGLSGTDSVRIVGTSGSDIFQVASSGIQVNGSSMKFVDTENLYIVGGAGNDVYQLDADESLGVITLDESGGGVDLLDFSMVHTAAVSVNLGLSTVQVLNPNLSLILKSASTFENVTGGDGADTLTGNALGNILRGGNGNDLLSGMSGNDTLEGEGGDDDIAGGNGNDTYIFDADVNLGSDTLNDSTGIETLDFSKTTADVVLNLSIAIAQTINGGLLSLALNSTTNFENVIGGDGNDQLSGNLLNNILRGGNGDDILAGNSGNDILEGEAGNDSLSGDAGNDTYLFLADANLGSDTATDTAGTDSISFAGTTFDIAASLGTTSVQAVNANLSLTLMSANAFENLIGGNGNDILSGSTIANSITGGAGNDIMAGGLGNDTYLFDGDLVLGIDSVVEEASGGTDNLNFASTTSKSVVVDLGSISSQSVVAGNLTLTLSSNASIENVTGGSLNDILTGNVLANSISGGMGDDTLNGMDGNDTLTGAAGDDLLSGGAGNDRYVFDGDITIGTDTIDESHGGVDTLDFASTSTRSITVDLSLAGLQPVNLNHSLVLGSGSTLENATGGALHDTITGNPLGNVLTGNAGDDILSGLAGDDLLIGGAGNDALNGGAENDVFRFDMDAESGIDIVTDTAGIDVLDFSLTSTIGMMLDLAVTSAQSLNSRLTLTLPVGTTIETVLGTALDDSIFGNEAANILVGNAGNDNLTGGGGRDLLIGGLGADTIDGGADDDILVGGRTTSDTSIAKLNVIHAEWISANAYSTRISNLRAGVGSSTNSLKAKVTVRNDSVGSVDSLTGGTGDDWFFKALDDVLTDLFAGETVDAL